MISLLAPTHMWIKMTIHGLDLVVNIPTIKKDVLLMGIILWSQRHLKNILQLQIPSNTPKAV